MQWLRAGTSSENASLSPCGLGLSAVVSRIELLGCKRRFNRTHVAVTKTRPQMLDVSGLGQRRRICRACIISSFPRPNGLQQIFQLDFHTPPGLPILQMVCCCGGWKTTEATHLGTCTKFRVPFCTKAQQRPPARAAGAPGLGFRV